MSTASDFLLTAEKSCSVGLRPDTWDLTARRSEYEVPEFAVYVEVFRGTLADACEKASVCRDEAGVWWIVGRLGARDRANTIRSPEWDGVQGVSETGRYLKGGGYAGPAVAFVALLASRDGRLALIIADNEMNDEALFSGVVHSFRFND
jgi:hypothetical protein